MDFCLNEFIDISHSPYSITYRGVRSWAASLSNRKSFVSTTHFKVAIAGVKNLLHLSNEELASFSLGSFSLLSLSAGILLFRSQKKFNLIVLVTKEI